MSEETPVPPTPPPVTSCTTAGPDNVTPPTESTPAPTAPPAEPTVAAKKAPAFLSQRLGEFSKIERMWAENGMVRMQKPDGTILNFTARQAAGRAKAINDMIPAMNAAQAPEEWVKETLRLVERVATVCREALRQAEQPDKRTACVQNMIQGKNADGVPLAAILPEEYWVNRFCTSYLTLTADEVRAVIRRARDMQQAEEVLKGVHRQRMQAAGQKLVQATDN
jgi:hypothetical protein